MSRRILTSISSMSAARKSFNTFITSTGASAQRSPLSETFVVEYRVQLENDGLFVYQVRFDDKEMAKLQALAKRRGVSAAVVLRELVRNAGSSSR